MTQAKILLGRPQRGEKRTKPVVKLCFVDLDDTLLESSAGMLHAIHVRMDAFIMKALGVNAAKAANIRALYWARFGSTFIGLWRYHHIDPLDFLPVTHDFDYAPYIRVSMTVAADLRALRSRGVRLVLFTNGPRCYAESVIRLMGLHGIFEEVCSSTDMRVFGDWAPKPSVRMLRMLCAQLRVHPSEAILIDDSPKNLRAAKCLGMRTFWCTGFRLRHGKIPHRRQALGVDHVIVRFRDMLRHIPKKKIEEGFR